MEGGKLLTQGAYGCIFDKPLKCRGKPQKGIRKGIAKVTETIDAKQELDIAKRLRETPLSKNYFVLASPESCQPLIEEKQTEKDLQDCHVMDRVSMRDMRQIYMPWGGKNLYEVDINPSKFNLVKFMIHMLEAVGTMTLQGISHFDLHPGNILLDAAMTPRIIDFGMAFVGPTITSEVVNLRWKVLRFGSPEKSMHWISNQEAPEITIVNAFAHGDYTIEDATRKVIYSKDIFAQIARPFLGVPRQTHVQEFLSFWSTSKVCQEKNWTEFFRLYWPGFDSWALGCIFLTFLITQTSFLAFVQSEEWNQHQEAIRATLEGMLEMNPRKRLDAIEALSVLDPGNAWLRRFAMPWLIAKQKQRAAFS